MDINFKAIEQKWQQRWEKAKIFQVKESSKKPKYYCLEMFPYPSGLGLHMGHAWNYSIGDILARFKIMQGFNVLHPMGYDALGLPAENAAIKEGIHPEEYTKKSIQNYIRQQKELGLSYDWSRVLSTADPSFYKWDQWIFLKMFEKGLAYQKESAVNWCPKCDTVLANEQVHDGKCWRHEDTEVKTKILNQWFFKTTAYAKELYENIDDLNWPQRTKIMQKNWIGKSDGVEIDFEIENKISNVIIVHGSPREDKTKEKDYIKDSEKGWLGWIKNELKKRDINCKNPQMPTPWSPKYSEWKKEFEKIKLNESSVLIGHSAGGAFLVRYLDETNQKIKKLILVSPGKTGLQSRDNMLDLYGNKTHERVKELVSEKIVIYTAEDDYEPRIRGAREYGKEFNTKVTKFKKGYGHFTSQTLAGKEFPKLLNEILYEKWPIFTTRPDTIFGVTFMVIAAAHPRLNELITKDQKNKVEKFLKDNRSVSQKDLQTTDKVGIFTGSYATNPINNEKIPIYAGNFVVADYGSGMVMAVPAHDQRDFEFAKKYGIEIRQVIKGTITKEKAYEDQGTIINSKKFDGIDNEEAKENISQFLIKNNLARKVTNFKLRDWGISRQRYWGTPIPIIHCKNCGAVPVPEKDLPIILPKKVKFGKGNPLETAKSWVNIKCPKCNGDAKRETDTMDTFVNSSWYFLRYTDPHNDKKIFDEKKVSYWTPIDTYIGGAEHACMHLIYFRFYTKFLRDLGLIKFSEPAKKLFHQGMLRAQRGEKMSKSKGNEILPETVSDRYGIDTARFFLSNLASPDKDIDWNEHGITGSLKFIQRIFRYFEDKKEEKTPLEVENKLNKTIEEMTEYYNSFEYRKATIALRELFNEIEKQPTSRQIKEKFLQLLSPICPHITEELWEHLGNKDLISISTWPKAKKVEEKSREENLTEKTIENIKKLIKENATKKATIYAMPFEIPNIDLNKIKDRTKIEIEIFAVNDPKKYDPQKKASKAKPGKPSVYFE